ETGLLLPHRVARVHGPAILTVQQLTTHGDGRIRVLDGDLEADDREMTLLEADDPLVAHPDALAARRHPEHITLEHPGAHVERPAVLAHVRLVEGERLIIDVQAHDLRIRRVDDGLADLGEAIGLLSVTDRPRLVQSVDECAVLVRTAAFDVISAQAEIAVAHGEECLSDTVFGVTRLGQAPGVDGEAVAVDHAVSEESRRNRARSSTIYVAPASLSASGPAPRSTPTTVAYPAEAAEATPDTASSTATLDAGST